MRAARRGAAPIPAPFTANRLSFTFVEKSSAGTKDARLLIWADDRPGIVSAVSGFLYRQGANIVHSSQHSTDPRGGTFFMRMTFQPPEGNWDRPGFEAAFREQVGEKLAMSWRFEYGDRQKRMAIMVSRYDHCLLELLWRVRSGEFPAHSPLVVSNHDDLRGTVESFGIEFHHLPVSRESKLEQERAVHGLLEGRADFIVLARYMQILSPEFVAKWPNRIINIHHSFLPAFVGANPYRSAYTRGVKLIGATAHYVTDDLDQGPIIEQDVRRVSHRESVKDLVRVGREVERVVLARAVAAHLEDRVLVYDNKTVVFD